MRPLCSDTGPSRSVSCGSRTGIKLQNTSYLINPKRLITTWVTAMTGISHAMTYGQTTFNDLIPAVQPLMHNAAILRHNVRFDLSLHHKDFHRCELQMTQLLAGAPEMNTVRIARGRFGRGVNALQTLARNHGYVPSVAHRALEDAITTAFDFEKLMEPVGGYKCCLCDALTEQGGPMGLMPARPRESLLSLEHEELSICSDPSGWNTSTVAAHVHYARSDRCTSDVSMETDRRAHC